MKRTRKDTKKPLNHNKCIEPTSKNIRITFHNWRPNPKTCFCFSVLFAFFRFLFCFVFMFLLCCLCFVFLLLFVAFFFVFLFFSFSSAPLSSTLPQPPGSGQVQATIRRIDYYRRRCPLYVSWPNKKPSQNEKRKQQKTNRTKQKTHTHIKKAKNKKNKKQMGLRSLIRESQKIGYKKVRPWISIICLCFSLVPLVNLRNFAALHETYTCLVILRNRRLLG